MFRGWSFKCLSWGAKRYNISLSKGDGTKHKLVSGGGGGGGGGGPNTFTIIVIHS